MLVTIGVSRLANSRVEIRVARPQHDWNDAQEYLTETETRAVLLALGIGEEAITSHLKLLALHVERVLQEMAGEIWIDAVQNRLALIHGVLMNDVKFPWFSGTIGEGR